MVSNIDRIYAEISKHAKESVDGNLDSDDLIELALQVVDNEDQHAIRKMNIKQVIETLIEQVANTQETA